MSDVGPKKCCGINAWIIIVLIIFVVIWGILALAAVGYYGEASPFSISELSLDAF